MLGTSTKLNLSNTFINYLQLTQYIERSYMEMRIKDTHFDLEPQDFSVSEPLQNP